MLSRVTRKIKQVREQMRPDAERSPVYFRLNDWIDIKAETDRTGKGRLYVIAMGEHKTEHPSIKAMRMKLHKAAKGMPYFELLHVDSRKVDEVEAYMLGHEINPNRKIVRMVHTFEVVTYPKERN
jgi:hypothetical protein